MTQEHGAKGESWLGSKHSKTGGLDLSSGTTSMKNLILEKEGWILEDWGIAYL